MKFDELISALGVTDNNLPAQQIAIDDLSEDDYIRHVLGHLWPGEAAPVINHPVLDCIDRPNSLIRIKGSVSILHVANMPALFEFWLDNEGKVQYAGSCKLPVDTRGGRNWRFSVSFPELPAVAKAGGPDYENITGGTEVWSREAGIPLDDLDLLDAQFVICTYALHRQTQIPLDGSAVVRGLNFFGSVSPGALFGWLPAITDSNSPLDIIGKVEFPNLTVEQYKSRNTKDDLVPLYPWDVLYWPDAMLPGISLCIPLPLNWHMENLAAIEGRSVEIYTPLSPDWIICDMNPALIPMMGYEAGATFPGDTKLDIVLELPYGARKFKLSAHSSGDAMSGIEKLDAMLGTEVHLMDSLPDGVIDVLKPITNVDLLDLSVLIDYTSGINVQNFTFTVGFPDAKLALFAQALVIDRIALQATVTRNNAANKPQLQIRLLGSIAIGGIDFRVEASNINGFRFSGTSTHAVNISFEKLIDALGISNDVTFPFELSIDTLTFYADIKSNYGVHFTFAEYPDTWSLDIGHKSLAVSDIVVMLDHSKAGWAKSLQGTISIAGLETTIYSNGLDNIKIQASLEKIKLSDLVGHFFDDTVIGVKGFDLTFDNSFVVLEKAGSAYDLALGTTIEHLGSVFFVIQKKGGWSCAAGLQLNVAEMDKLPMVGNMIREYLDWVPFKALTIIFSNGDPAGFTFPAPGDFGSQPQSSSAAIQLPSAKGVISKGIMIHSKVEFPAKGSHGVGSKILPYIAELLHIPEGSALDVVVCSDPMRDKFQLGLVIDTYLSEIVLKDNHIDEFKSSKISGTLQVGTGGAGDLELQETVSLKTNIADKDLEFDLMLMIEENGLFASGTLKTPKPIEIGPVKIGNLAVELGISFEGAPSFGFSGQLEVDNLFDSSLAVLIDTTMPQKSMIAGAVSDLDFGKIMDTLTGTVAKVSMPVAAGFESVIRENEALSFLRKLKILGTADGKFLVAGDNVAKLTKALNGYDGQAIADIFQKAGKLPSFPASSPDLTIFPDGDNGRWYITEHAGDSIIRHWQLVKDPDADTIAVSKEAQFYFAPTDTQIGSFRYNQGMMVSGRVAFNGFEADVDIEIEIGSGLKAEASLSQIVVGNEQWFKLASASGEGGPKLIICTYHQKNQASKELNSPHFLIDGSLTIFNATQRLYLFITSGGTKFRFDVATAAPGSGLHGTLAGTLDEKELSVAGKLFLVPGDLPLGLLGHVQLPDNIEFDFQIWANSGGCGASCHGELQFQGHTIQYSRSISGTDYSFADIRDQLLDELKAQVTGFFKSAMDALAAIKAGILTGVNYVGRLLKDHYKIGAGAAAGALKEAGYGVNEICTLIRSAYNCSASEAISSLEETGCKLADAVAAVEHTFQNGAANMAYVLGNMQRSATEVGTVFKLVYGLDGATTAGLLPEFLFHTEDVGMMLKNVFNGNRNGITKILRDSGHRITAIGSFLKNSLQLSEKEIASDFKLAGYTADEIGGEMMGLAERGANSVSDMLKSVSFNASETSVVLRSVFWWLRDGAQTAGVLKAAAYPCNEVSLALKNVFNFSEGLAVGALKGAGFPAAEVGAALKNTFSATETTAIAALKSAGYVATEIGGVMKSVYGESAAATARLLKEAGFVSIEVGNAIKDTFFSTVSETVAALKSAGYGITEIGSVVRSVYHETAATAGTLLKNVGSSAADVGLMLRDTYNLWGADTASALKHAGYQAEEVGQAIVGQFQSLGPQYVAESLKFAGYTVNQTGVVIKSAFNLGKNELDKFLRSANYATHHVESFIKHIFGL